MESTLMVIGLNHRTAPLAVRERFYIEESRRSEVLLRLASAEGIEEVVVLSTCNRTEFLIWANDPALAANSVLRYLSTAHGLKLCEWRQFYRLLDEEALHHFFRVACSLDSMVLGEPQIVDKIGFAWALAQRLGTSGRFLDAVVQKALTVSQRVRTETAIERAAVSVPMAGVEMARELFGQLDGLRVLLLGAGKMGELSARHLVNHRAASLCVINRTLEHARDLADHLGGTAASFEERWQRLLEADIVISSTACPHFILTRDEAQAIAEKRQNRRLCIIDIAVPRDIDPEVRHVNGFTLFDMDDLERSVKRDSAARAAAAEAAEGIVGHEAQEFRHRLHAEHVVPTVIALRQRLDELCRQELESYRREAGPFVEEQDAVLAELASRVTQKIAAALARELKSLHERNEQEQMTAAVQKLFHLDAGKSALAGAQN